MIAWFSRIIERIRLFFFRRGLKKELEDHQVIHSNLAMKDARTVGILFDATEPRAHVIVEDYAKELSRRNKKVKMLGFIDTSQANEHINFNHFSRKDLNWCLIPQSHIPLDFMNASFDVLMNAYFEPLLPLYYISSLSKAKMRVGVYLPEKTELSDVMINLGGEANLDVFFSELDQFLKIIN